jgi:hypothetical protein
VSKDVLDSISKLEGIHIAQSELNMSINDELSKTQNLSTKMESVAETRLLSLFRRECLDRLQVQVVIQV